MVKCIFFFKSKLFNNLQFKNISDNVFLAKTNFLKLFLSSLLSIGVNLIIEDITLGCGSNAFGSISNTFSTLKNELVKKTGAEVSSIYKSKNKTQKI